MGSWNRVWFDNCWVLIASYSQEPGEIQGKFTGADLVYGAAA